MERKENKHPRDENNNPHGYWEQYHYNGNLCYKGCFIHNKENGYWVQYSTNGFLNFKKYYIK